MILYPRLAYDTVLINSDLISKQKRLNKST